MISNWIHIKKNYNVFLRGNMLWVDYQKGQVRVRKSTKLKYSKTAFLFVSKNIERYTEIGAEISLKNEFLELEDKRIITKIERKENKSSIKTFEENALSPRNIFEKFFREKSFLKRATLASYRAKFSILENFFKKNSIEIITDFKRDDCIAFMEFLVDRGFKGSSINIYFNFLNTFLNYAFENNFIENKPFFKPKRKLEISSSISPFDLEQVKLLLDNSSGFLRLYLYIAFFTGMRVGEILALNWGDIDFINNEIKITKSISATGIIDTPKTISSLRTIDMLDILKKQLLAVRKTKNDRIFNISVWVLRHRFETLLNELGIKKHRLYDCRHTFASIMLSRGEEPMWVGCKMLGHKDLNETYKSYAKYLPKAVAERAKFLENEFN